MGSNEPPQIGHGFRGDPSFVHALEGHGAAVYGRSCYWPGGQSGVTLDPGFDLGYQKREQLEKYYASLLTDEQMQACLRSGDVRGEAADRRIQASGVLRSILLTRAEASALFPMVARPYWTRVAQRFPALLDERVPPAVHTVFLSLAYNRGAANDALAQLAEPLAERNWMILADHIEAMQDRHPVEGVTKRRDEEASYLDEHAEAQSKKQRQKEQLAAEVLRRVDVASVDAPPVLPSEDLIKKYPFIADAAAAPPSGAPSLSTASPPPAMATNAAQKAAQEKAGSASTLDDARDVVDEIFDDPEDKEVVIDKLNAAVDVPGIPESMEGVIISQALEGIIYAAESVDLT